MNKESKTERIFKQKKKPYKPESMNKDQVESLKIEDIKTWIWQLPITLTETPEDSKYYFSGCNELHNHKYEEAKRLFEEGLKLTNNEHSKQILSFNLAYATYKLSNI